MDPIDKRILLTAIEMTAAEGEVRQRDVAARAGVALGTLYSRFPTKDVLLVTALQLEAEKVENSFRTKPIRERRPSARVHALFERTTTSFTGRPKLARAILRATVSSDPACTKILFGYQEVISRLAADALRGGSNRREMPADVAIEFATILAAVWYAGLVGWSGDAFSPNDVVALVDRTAGHLIASVEATRR